MIYTRFGSQVTITGAQHDLSTIYVQYTRASDGEARECAIHDLKADGGATEIQAAIVASGAPEFQPGYTEETRVYFRMFGGEVIALFPDDTADLDGNVTSYMHLGQHGAANLQLVMEASRPATIVEYAALKRELESIGYHLVTIIG